MSPNSDSPVITRFAPSPTGSLHLGNARTAFFSYLWARRSGGRFILRIEDTDAERSQRQFRDQLLSELRWLGLDWDEGPDVGGPSAPYLQSERGGIYQELFARLESQELAYPCYCTPQELELSRKLQLMSGRPPRYDGTCRDLTSAQRSQREARGLKSSLRFRVPPHGDIEFIDTVHGIQRFTAADIGDFIIRRDDGSAAFFFGNAVDDSLMGITQVLRGDDHMTNTPRQLLLLDALGMRKPGYGHVGLLVGVDGEKLSKRHGSISVQDLHKRGFLSAALLNQLFRLGHTSGIDAWLAPVRMAQNFRPDHLGKAPARFDEAQSLHWQKETLQRMSGEEIRAWLGADGDDTTAFVELVRHNVVLPADADAWRAVVRGELGPLGADEERIIAEAGRSFFAAAAAAFDQADSDLQSLTKILKDKTGRKGAALFMPLRVALTGHAHGPELAQLLRMIPPSTARRRLQLHA